MVRPVVSTARKMPSASPSVKWFASQSNLQSSTHEAQQQTGVRGLPGTRIEESEIVPDVEHHDTEMIGAPS
jgi:hypothetical protein